MMSFIQYFQEQLLQRTCMPFVEFMHYALYAPFVGYYSANRLTIGKHGDFITAPELTSLFGYTLANQCNEIFKHLNRPILFEFGAGSGKLCVDLMKAFQQMDALPYEYHILDVSAALKEQQQAYIQQEIPELFSRFKWLTHWPTEAFEGVLIANEVLDAMPVHRFLKTEEGLFESMVRYQEASQRFEECFLPCKNALLKEQVTACLSHDVMPYLSEVNLFIDDWLSQCAALLKRGALLILDYGFPQHEYYHPDRNQGTLMCHAKHQSHTDPFNHPGNEDITAHVDFTHVATAAVNAGFHVAGYTHQAAFLLANDLLSFLDPSDFNNTQAVKQLTHPNEMGELFKVIALTKDLDIPLRGFQFNDKRASL